jgi:hypothetical protein
VALVASLRGDPSIGTALLDRLSEGTGRTHTWDHIYLTLWHCEELLPEDVWEQFFFQTQAATPVSFAFAARSYGGLDLLSGFLETEKYDAIGNLWNGLMAGVQGNRS